MNPTGPTTRAQRVRALESLVRRLTVESQRLAHAFAEQQHLHSTDLEALIHVMDVPVDAQPMTPGRLGEALGLSSGATTAVIDRLESHGHLERERDPIDRRRIYLHYAPGAMELAQGFFGPLSTLSAAVTDRFTDDELDVIAQYLTLTADAIQTHRNTVERPSP